MVINKTMSSVKKNVKQHNSFQHWR